MGGTMQQISRRKATPRDTAVVRESILAMNQPKSEINGAKGNRKEVTFGSISAGEKTASRMLSLRQEMFLRFYVLHGNAARAAKEAGYRPPYNVTGAKVLRSGKLHAAVRDSLRSSGLNREEIISLMVSMLRFDMGNFLRIDMETGECSIDLGKGMSTGAMCIVKNIAWRKGKVAGITLHDPVKIISRILRLCGWEV
jgi:hypothetical protein